MLSSPCLPLFTFSLSSFFSASTSHLLLPSLPLSSPEKRIPTDTSPQLLPLTPSPASTRIHRILELSSPFVVDLFFVQARLSLLPPSLKKGQPSLYPRRISSFKVPVRLSFILTSLSYTSFPWENPSRVGHEAPSFLTSFSSLRSFHLQLSSSPPFVPPTPPPSPKILQRDLNLLLFSPAHVVLYHGTYDDHRVTSSFSFSFRSTSSYSCSCSSPPLLRRSSSQIAPSSFPPHFHSPPYPDIDPWKIYQRSRFSGCCQRSFEGEGKQSQSSFTFLPT